MVSGSIALIGYRGTGKSTVGTLLARRLGMAFVDTDRLVESRSGESIASIFARGGEDLFRDYEAAALNSLPETSGPWVIACGGGIVLRRENRAALQNLAPGRIFLLTAPVEVIACRVSGDARSSQTRPPLTDLSLEEEIRDVLQKRDPLYRETADHLISTEEKKPAEIVEEICRLL
ncbi:MAG: shikimate kinase [Thermoguttaceae bacterium]|nr:shikimate kinase [Thermoguttaceae bacterium]